MLSAAEIDQSGNLNTVRLPNGRWITGSGGANDIASSSDCVVIAPASPHRYVRSLEHTTSPGSKVQALVAQFGAFTRTDDGSFALSSWLPLDTPDAPDTPEATVARFTMWDDAVSGPSLREEPISAEELACVRAMDPQGDYR